MNSELIPYSDIPNEDLARIKTCKYNLEKVSFMMKVFNSVGAPIDAGLLLIPEKYQGKLNLSIQKALQIAVRANLTTMHKDRLHKKASNNIYKLVTGISGAAGGFFGAAGFSTDLLISTKFMMRSILDIARSQGEDIHDISTQLACLQVFALGGNTDEDDEVDTGYYAIRAALQTATAQASSYIAEHGTKKLLETLASQSSAPIARLISQVASRYSIQVGEKFAAQAVPVIGAAAGASINVIFINHFQKMATSHFTLRKLEKIYGTTMVKDAYDAIEIDVEKVEQ